MAGVPMRVAILGAGAAGLATAWMLDPSHDVVVFEREPMAGGHVRTLGGNVTAPTGLPRLDVGVIELESRNFPTVGRLLDRLDVKRVPVPGTTTMLQEDGTRLFSFGSLSDRRMSVVADLAALARLTPHVPAFRRFLADSATLTPEQLRGRTLGEILPDGVTGRWLSLLVLYAYSTPLDEVHEVAAEMAAPMLRAFSDPEGWYAIDGGIWTWMSRVIEGMRGELRTSCAPVGISRDDDGVNVQLPGGERERFDAVVLALPPHAILPLLTDADDVERRWLSGFRGREIHTVLHHDAGLYTRRRQHYRAEFDCFELGDGRGGYNARLDRLCALDAAEHPYGLAYGLDDELDPAAIVWRQRHEVSAYTATALRHREEVRAAAGRRHTYFAGAWLGDGLHEGAVASALAVSRLLGGREP